MGRYAAAGSVSLGQRISGRSYSGMRICRGLFGPECSVAAGRWIVSTPEQIRYHGQRVIVYDAKGRYECRGVIVGRHKVVAGDTIYDVQPDQAESMAKRICGIPASQLRSAQPESAEPQNVMDTV